MVGLMRFNIVGLIAGLALGCVAISVGSPDFFTVKHAQSLRVTLAPH
jgi:hypothetical protein